jgi:ATP/maltotriose-dependent transcriptional regulator MalT
LRVAIARLEAGGGVEPELMTEAARRSLGAYDLVLGERLARVALDAGGGLRAGLALASALARQGRQREAERVFERIDTTGASDDDRALLAIEWSECRFWGQDDHRGATQLLTDAIEQIEDPDWRDRLVITNASYDLLRGKAADALAAVEHIREIGTPRGIAAVALVAAPALQLLGRGDEAMSALEEAVLPFDEPDAPTDAMYLGMLVIAMGLVAVDLGRFADARLFAQGGHDETVASGIVLAQAWFALILGRTSMAEGDLADAERWFREAAACFDQTGNRPNEKLCLFSAAWTLALQGRGDPARALAEEARRIESGHVRLQEPLVLRAEAALAVAEGDRAAALALLHDAAAVSRKLELRSEELGALHDLARMGEVDEVIERVDALAAALAARRLPSKEIAAQLDLSRRTVDNHLQRAYAKLGVTTARAWPKPSA